MLCLSLVWIGLLVESLFAVWVGSRGYHIASSYTEGTYEMVSQIPLCPGRSSVSEALCDEWIDITRTQVPSTFWQNLDAEKGLQDIRTWRAIQAFAENCVKRKTYESVLRSERGIMDDNEPVVLPSKVPDDVLSFSISKEEARGLSTDR